ncbi:hypothetical protein SOPP22_10645 [Shewanella sp. OPT22]|nr:hypothetical protein SOPP22_10645 [Shewanella sp. OPT22]
MLSIKRFIIFLVLFVAGLIWFYADQWYRNYLFERYYNSTEYSVNEYQAKLSAVINQRLKLVSSLAHFVESELQSDPTYSDSSRQHIDSFMSALYHANEGLRAFTIAPNFIVNQVYPITSNESAIGHNLRDPSTPFIYDAVDLAITENIVTHSQPYELVQGGLGLVARLPVFQDDKVWGVVSVVLDIVSTLENAGVIGPSSEFDFAFRSDNGNVFFGDPTIFDTSSLIRKIKLPSGYWEIAAQPRNTESGIEWQANLFGIFLAALILLILGALYSFYQHVYLAERSYREQENELADSKGLISGVVGSKLRQTRPTFITPAIATIAILLACIAFFYFIQTQNKQQDSQELTSNLEVVVNEIGSQINANRDYLEILAEELGSGTLSINSFEQKAARYVKDHPGIINITFADESFTIRNTAPYDQNKQVIGLKLSLAEPERASRLAKELKVTVFTKPFVVIQGKPAFEFYVPVYRGDKFLGTLGAVYSIPNLAEEMILSNLSSRYNISFLNERRKPIYTLSDIEHSMRLAHSVPFPYLNQSLWLKFSVKQSHFSNGMQLILLVILLFISGIVFSFWLQFKESARVWQTGKSLLESQQHFHSIAHSAPIAVVITQPESGKILYANLRAEELLSSLGEAVVGKNIRDFYANPDDRKLFIDLMIHKQRVDGFELKIKTDSGRYVWGSLSSKMVDYAEGKALITSVTDLTQQRTYQDQLYKKANFDELTGLPNRGMAFERLTSAINIAKQNQGEVVLMLLDLDDFKKVNDSFGHNAGDKLLKQISKRIRGVISEYDTIGRLGGDEFVIILTAPDSVKNAEQIAHEVIDLCSRPVLIQHYEVVVGCSIGLACFPQDGNDYETLTKNADAAMYESKVNGRNALCFYSNKMSQDIQQRLVMENELRQALKRDELYIVYQPIIDGDTGRVIAAEALMRWQNDRLGNVSPEQFIPLAESLGLISTFGEWLLDQACHQVKKWQKIENGPEYVSVNVSSRQLRNDVIIEDVKLALTLHQLPASVLELELTESALIEHTEENERIFDTLHQMGVRLAVDDFGTGYSSLNYLRRFSFDTLKIDRSFIGDIPDKKDAIELVQAIHSMATSMGMKIVAEGVENREQLSFLQELGCDAIQGYYISKPLSKQDIISFCSQKQQQVVTIIESVKKEEGSLI